MFAPHLLPASRMHVYPLLRDVFFSVQKGTEMQYFLNVSAGPCVVGKYVSCWLFFMLRRDACRTPAVFAQQMRAFSCMKKAKG